MTPKDADKYEASMARMYAKPKFAVWSSTPLRLWAYELQFVRQYCRDENMCILTAGCGAGREPFALHNLGFHNVCGVDLTPEFIAIAKQRCCELSVDIPFHVASIRNMPLPDNHFDLATMFENVYGSITPRAGRLEALAEVRRVLKPNGVLLIIATSICEFMRYHLAIRAMEIFRHVWNPCHLERGDKLTFDARQVEAPAAELSRSHWFRPREIDEEAKEASLEVVQATTAEGIMSDPAATSRSYRGKGRLLYALRKPSEKKRPQ